MDTEPLTDGDSSSPDPRHHVVHVINSLGVSGGAEQQLVNNLNHFRDTRLRHSVVALFSDDYGTRAHEVPSEVSVHYVFDAHQGGGLPNRLGIIRALDRALSGMGADLLHCSVAEASLAARIVGRRRRIPVVETLVNISHESIRLVDSPAVKRWKLQAHTLVDRITMRSVARFHALTEAVADSWHRTVRIPTRKIVTIPRGITVETPATATERAAARESVIDELGLAPDALIALNVGRQAAQKGQRYLIEAMPRALDAVPSLHVLIAGQPGNMTNRLPHLIDSLGATGHVHLLGARNDVPRLMRAADVFVFPSLYEGMGVALLQAMGAGLPVIVGDRAPMAGEIVTHDRDGLVVPTRNPAALADAITRLASDTSLQTRLGSAAADAATGRYDADDVAGRLEVLYHEVLDQPQSSVDSP